MTETVTVNESNHSFIKVRSVIDKLSPTSSDSDRFAALLVICKATTPVEFYPEDFPALFNKLGHEYLLRMCASNHFVYIDICLQLFALSIKSSTILGEFFQNHSQLISPAITGGLTFLDSRKFVDEDFPAILRSLGRFIFAISFYSPKYVLEIPEEIVDSLFMKPRCGNDLEIYRHFLDVMFMLINSMDNTCLMEKVLSAMISNIRNDKIDFKYMNKLSNIFVDYSLEVSEEILPHLLSVIADPLRTPNLESKDLHTLLRFIYLVSTALFRFDEVAWIFKLNPSLGAITFHRTAIEFNLLAINNKFTEKDNYLVDLLRFLISFTCRSETIDGFIDDLLKKLQECMIELFDSIEFDCKGQHDFKFFLGTESALSRRFDLYFTYLAEDSSYLKNKGLLKTFEILIGGFSESFESVEKFTGPDLFRMVDLFNNVLIPGLLNSVPDPDYADIFVETGMVNILLECLVKFCNFVEINGVELNDYVSQLTYLLDDSVLGNMLVSNVDVPRCLIDRIKDCEYAFKSSSKRVFFDLLHKITRHFPL